MNKSNIDAAITDLVKSIVRDESSDIDDLRSEVESLREDMDSKFDNELEDHVDNYLNALRNFDVKRLNAIDSRLDNLETRFTKIEQFIQQAETVSRFLADVQLLNKR